MKSSKKIFLIASTILFFIILLIVLFRKEINLNLITKTFQIPISEITKNLISRENKEDLINVDVDKDEYIPIEIKNRDLIPNEIEIYGSRYSFTIKTNKEIKIDENQKFINLQKVSDQDYIYVVSVENIGEDESTRNIKIKSTDRGNKQENIELKIRIKRIPFLLPFGIKEIPEWENFKFTNIYNDLLIIVDKKNKLPANYEPIDLVNLGNDPYYLYTNIPNIRLRKEAADSLKIMLSKYKSESKENLVIASGYRSYNEQYKIYSGWVKQLGIEEADRISARPGYSEHQLGTVVDFINQESGLELTEKFSNTKAYKWLTENAYKYGFVLSYPQLKEEITGYKFEPWHWRYIGIDNAKDFITSNKTLNIWLKDKIKN